MSDSVFDPEAFLRGTTQGASSTQAKAVPVGEYPAIVDDVKARAWRSEAKGTSGVALDILWSIDSDTVRNELGRDKVVVQQGLMLDITPSGGLDMGEGKNWRLGRVRDATGLNDPSVDFNFLMLKGRAAKVKVEHEVYQGAPMAKVTGVVKLA